MFEKQTQSDDLLLTMNHILISIAITMKQCTLKSHLYLICVKMYANYYCATKYRNNAIATAQ